MPPAASNTLFALAGVVALACQAQSAHAGGVAKGPQPAEERVRRGIVLVEQRGTPIAMGTVLGRDGRVLTALSGLAGASGVDLRYADGSVVHAQVGRSDKASDLALLVPQSLAWTDGLDASDVEPDGAELRAISSSRGGFGIAPAEVRGVVAAHGQRGQPTVRMLVVNIKAPTMAGSPLLDAGGRVAAVLVRACKVVPTFPATPTIVGGESLPLPPPPCAPETLGAPVSSIRSFLVSPWLGIRGEPEKQGNARGVRVLATAPASPAERAGLRPNADVVVAVDGEPVDTPERLAETIGKHAAGDAVTLLVLNASGFRDVAVRLSGAPR